MSQRVPEKGRRKASLALKFVVVGGSIGGLACAYALRAAGHDVIVVEQSDGKTRSTGGIRSSPNMTRILNSWASGDALANFSVKCRDIFLNDGNTGHLLAKIKVHEELSRSLLGSLFLLQHGELHSLLLEMALKAGVEFRFNSTVTTVDPISGTVHLANGESISGDVVVGADGCNSMVRSVVQGPQSNPGVQDPFVFLTATAPMDLMRQDEDLRDLTENPIWSVWMGDGSAVQGAPSFGKGQYCLTLILPRKPDSPPFPTHYWDQFSVDDPIFDFKEFEPRVLKILKLAKTVTPTNHTLLLPLESWVHDNAKVVLVGDAAHPLPNGLYHISMTLEDAVTLGNLFSRLKHPIQVPLLLSAYEELRQPRCTAARTYTRKKREFITLPHGPRQVARDERMRNSMVESSKEWDDANEDYLKGTWQDYVDEFRYDANEMVDDWWSKWGSYVERCRKPIGHRASASTVGSEC